MHEAHSARAPCGSHCVASLRIAPRTRAPTHPQILKEVKLDAASPNLLVGATTSDDAAV
jgi:hypothetical protein